MDNNGSTAATNHNERIRNILLAVIATLLVVGALKLTQSVTLPLVFALFLIAVFWPLQKWLEERMPRGLAAVVTLFVFILVIAALGGSLWYSAEIVAQKAPQYQAQWQQYADQMRSRAQEYGLSMPKPGDAAGMLPALARQVFSFSGGFVLAIGFLVLGLLEVYDYRAKLAQLSGNEERMDRWLQPVRRITRDFQRYIVVRTVIGLLTGAGVAVFGWIIGLDFAFTWGVINFLLNYIPTLGSVVAVVPPTLFALAQFQSVGMMLLTLAVVGGFQLLMGNYIDPLLQGKYLALSPLVVLLSVVFWGWVWGITGAFIGVPLTVAVVIVCKEFEATRWIAVLLASLEEEPAVAPAGEQSESG